MKTLDAGQPVAECKLGEGREALSYWTSVTVASCASTGTSGLTVNLGTRLVFFSRSPALGYAFRMYLKWSARWAGLGL